MAMFFFGGAVMFHTQDMYPRYNSECLALFMAGDDIEVGESILPPQSGT
jgi:hypothetical protein